MRILEALVKAIFGTDERALRDRERTDAMLREAEARVDRLHRTLDNRPAANLDEAMQQMSGER